MSIYKFTLESVITRMWLCVVVLENVYCEKTYKW